MGEPVLSRRRKGPMRFGDRLCEEDFTKTAKDLHRQDEANDTIVASIHAGPARPTRTYHSLLESLLMKACKKWHVMTRIWTSFAISNNWTSDKEHICVLLQLWALSLML